MYTSRTSRKKHRYLLPAGTCQGEPLHLHLWRWRRWGGSSDGTKVLCRSQMTVKLLQRLRPLGKTLSRLAWLGRMAALDSISPSLTSFGWPGSPRGEWLHPPPESDLQLRMAATYTLPARVCGAHPHTICRPAQQVVVSGEGFGQSLAAHSAIPWFVSRVRCEMHLVALSSLVFISHSPRPLGDGLIGCVPRGNVRLPSILSRIHIPYAFVTTPSSLQPDASIPGLEGALSPPCCDVVGPIASMYRFVSPHD